MYKKEKCAKLPCSKSNKLLPGFNSVLNNYFIFKIKFSPFLVSNKNELIIQKYCLVDLYLSFLFFCSGYHKH